MLINRSDHALSQWSTRYSESIEGLKDSRAPLRLKTLMENAGFKDVSRLVLWFLTNTLHQVLNVCTAREDPKQIT